MKTWMNKTHLNRRRISSILAVSFLLTLLSGITGCGKKTEGAPELIEPVTSLLCYRPVSKRIVGNTKLLYGTVVPTDYPCFSEKQVQLLNIKVGVGDYVEEGDVIAEAVSSVDEAEGLSFDIAALGRKRDWLTKVSNKTVEKLEYEKKVESKLKNKDGVKEKETAISTEKENLRYELAVIDNQLRIDNSDLAKIREKNTNQVFTASHSGYVTFVKDVAESNMVSAYENIAVISDFDDLYIESPEVDIEKYEYTDYKSKWIMLDGERVKVKEREYTNKEISYALSVKRNPYISFVPVKGKLKMGESVTLYFNEGELIEKLAVGEDSIYRENGEAYVYVQGDGKNDEYRKIETGVTDGLYTEVKSGLEEGEMVYYKNSALVPVKYEVIEASPTDYVEETKTKVLERATPYTDIYLSDIEGKFKKYEDIFTATEGDSFCEVKSKKGTADVEAARVDIEKLVNERTKQNKEYNKAKKEIEKIKKHVKKVNMKEMASDTDAIRANLYRKEISDCELDILEYNENYYKNEYSENKYRAEIQFGKVRKGTDAVPYVINARNTGKIRGVLPVDDSDIYVNSFITAINYRDPADKKLFSMSADGGVAIGGTITIKSDDKEWTGKCIGINGDDARFCLFTRNNKQYSTYSASRKNAKFQMYIDVDEYIEKEDLEKAEITFPSFYSSSVVVLPGTSVKTETSELTGNQKKFVWKKEGDQIVKEYVTTYSGDVVTGKEYILSGVEPGDLILK